MFKTEFVKYSMFKILAKIKIFSLVEIRKVFKLILVFTQSTTNICTYILKTVLYAEFFSFVEAFIV
jgi:hypothetical protein